MSQIAQENSTHKSTLNTQGVSQIFNAGQIKVIEQIGDIMIPRADDFPSFSELGAIHAIDRIMAPAHPQDIKDLGMLLTLLRFMPAFIIRLILTVAVNAHKSNGFISPLLRQLDIGLRGIIYSLYYANLKSDDFKGKTPFDVMEFELNCPVIED